MNWTPNCVFDLPIDQHAKNQVFQVLIDEARAKSAPSRRSDPPVFYGGSEEGLGRVWRGRGEGPREGRFPPPAPQGGAFYIKKKES